MRPSGLKASTGAVDTGHMDVRRMALAAGLLAAVAAVAATLLLSAPRTTQHHAGIQPQTGTQALNGTGFATSYPPGWGLTVKPGPLGLVAYQLSSTRAPINGLGIPPAGAIGITISETPTAALKVLHLTGARPDTAVARQSPVELLPNVVGTPGLAARVTRTESPHPTTLGGAAAAEESYAYTFAGHENIQIDVLCRHGSGIVLVELDAEPALAQESQAALETITQQWGWR
jgi:hypothetical protein